MYQFKKEGSNSKLRSEKLDEIDMVILKHYLPVTFSKYCDLENMLIKEQKEHEKTKNDLLKLQAMLKVYEEASTSAEKLDN